MHTQKSFNASSSSSSSVTALVVLLKVEFAQQKKSTGHSAALQCLPGNGWVRNDLGTRTGRGK
jgi:hypothetical protein